MKKIKVFVEGGPTGTGSADGKAALGQGFRQLFQNQKQSLAKKHIQLDFTFCGGRGTARKKFESELKANVPNQTCVLLVDSEAPFTRHAHSTDAESRKYHLSQRTGDEWKLTDVDPNVIHLMIECMETWILADPEAIALFYGQGFPVESMPKRENLEDLSKQQVAEFLDQAIDRTKKAQDNPKKRGYKKVDHGSKLLAAIDPQKVAKRCPHFAIFVEWLESQASTT